MWTGASTWVEMPPTRMLGFGLWQKTSLGRNGFSKCMGCPELVHNGVRDEEMAGEQRQQQKQK